MAMKDEMTTERSKRKTLPGIKTTTSTPQAEQYAVVSELTEHNDGKKPGRTLTKALRSLSSSSLDSAAPAPTRNSSFVRRLQKTPSGTSFLKERLNRRYSKDSCHSPVTPSDVPGSPLSQPLHAMDVLHHGHLKTDVSLLKARSDYLVLTDKCLVRMSSVEAAKGVFPRLRQKEGSESESPNKSALADIKLEIPLQSIVASFNEEGSSPRFGIEIWWFSAWPKIAYCKAHLFFSMPRERDDWLAAIQKACKARLAASPLTSVVPDNLKTRISHLVASSEPTPTDGGSQNLTFPVARRLMGVTSKSNVSEEAQAVVDTSSFYLVIGPCMCYFVEVLSAEYTTLPGDLRLKVTSFGTVTLTRFRASVATREQRFVMGFRSPFGRETRLDLASSHYRRIIEALTKVDRILKPMWPQHLQQLIFDVRGLPPPLQLTSGNDLGGVVRSLEAYCAAYNVRVPEWIVDWSTASLPAFRLLPSQNTPYLPLQLLAVFRALRYNSYFKAICLRDVDLSSLTARKEQSQYGDNIVTTSLSGWRISEEHFDILKTAPILVQEIHALMFASETIKSIDLSNTLGIDNDQKNSRLSCDFGAVQRCSSELIRPMLMLLRRQLFHGHSFSMSGNPLLQSDIEELANLLVLDHVCLRKLELARCRLGDVGLTKLWSVLVAQADCIETLDTSHNAGTVKPELLVDALGRCRSVRRLKIAGNTRLPPGMCLFEPNAIHSWQLQELDLSGIALNDATVTLLADYLSNIASQGLETLALDRCGLTGHHIACLLRGMGQGRPLTLHVDANRLDEGIDDLCDAIACGYGPCGLFLQMVEFNLESSYIKLLRALSVNETIECLSLAGSTTPDAASEAACEAVADFFAQNAGVRYLDISGYDAKLDDGRLGRGFSTALRGLRSNASIEHLRVRSQMLNFNIGDLAEAISANTTLRTLDCEGNDFNLSNYRHLIKHLRDNTSIRYFSAFSDEDLSKTVRKSVDNVQPSMPARRASVLGRFRHERSTPSQIPNGGVLLGQLRAEWDVAVEEVQEILARNQATDREARNDNIGSPAYIQCDVDGVFATCFGGLALRDYECQWSKSCLASATNTGDESEFRDEAGQLFGATVAAEAGEVSRNYSTASSNTASSACSEGGSTGSGPPTPPELISPSDREYELGLSNTQSPETDLDEPAGVNYHLGHDFAEGDFGLMMKSHRRFRSDPVSRIEEEIDGSDGEQVSS